MFEQMVFLPAILYQMRVCGGAGERDWRPDFYSSAWISLLRFFFQEKK